MGRAVLVLTGQDIKAKAHAWIEKAPWNTRITFQGPRRSVSQNARMWAMLTDVATQVGWHGIKLSPDDWKLMFLDAMKREVRMVPNLDGNGFVSLGRSSSDLDKQEMSDLMEIISAWGATQGIAWSDPVDNGEDDATPDVPADLDIPHAEQEAIHETQADVRMETGETVRSDSGDTVAFDPLAWADEFEAGLPGWTDPDLLKEEWADLEATRGLLRGVSESTAKRLHDLVILHIKSLRAGTKAA